MVKENMPDGVPKVGFDLIMDGENVGNFPEINKAILVIRERRNLSPFGVATCPTSNKEGLADGRGVAVFDPDTGKTFGLILKVSRNGGSSNVSLAETITHNP